MICRIYNIVDPHDKELLRQVASHVTGDDWDDVGELLDDMHETLRAFNGVGLAAPQIGALVRVVVLHVPGHPELELVNPIIEGHSTQRMVPDFKEGCLSVPGLWGNVERYAKVLVRYQDRVGVEQLLHADDYKLAVVVQHELDHLNGVLFIDKRVEVSRV